MIIITVLTTQLHLKTEIVDDMGTHFLKEKKKKDTQKNSFCSILRR